LLLTTCVGSRLSWWSDVFLLVANLFLVGYTQIMAVSYSDTHPKMEQMQLEIIRRMPSWKKFAIVDDLNETVKAFAISGIKQSHPDATAEKIQRLLAERMLGAVLARKVYDHAR
jgi:hypothetical protein